MKSVVSFSDLLSARDELSGSVGLVPTMGYLHEGHLSLVQRARKECESIVVSIFVNTIQFAPEEDLETYPRDIVRDKSMLKAEGVDLVWIPSTEVMYPDDFQSTVTVEGVTQPLDGVWRPTHFQGVTTVVAKLFNAVRPDKAYFGQKDAQQVVVIKQMIRDLNYPIEIVVSPTIRERDGLAMSSRNTYLNTEQRQAALSLFQGLFQAKDAFEKGVRDADRLRQIVIDRVDQEKLVELQYVSCAHLETLDELDGKIDRALLSMAVCIGEIRLIDNVLLE